MIQMHSDQLKNCLSASQESTGGFEFHGVEIDSRRECQGRLFIAIRGDNFDGHDFVARAAEKGAVAAVVERRLALDLPQIVVADCRQALAQLARCWRRQLAPTLVAITGSNGKTTVKEMLGRILSASAPVLVTAGNLNNDIGVPLTLLALEPQQRFAVIEMGANHVGEIAQLVSIAEPDIVYVNNARAAHVEGFGSLDKVVEAKGEMYAHSSDRAIAVYNEDEASVERWKANTAAAQHVGFSMLKHADVQGRFTELEAGLQLSIEYKGDMVKTTLQVMGRHNAQNALAAMTLALACGLQSAQAAAALDGFGGVRGRQEFKQGPAHSRLIDDSYNANPDSLAAAIDVATALPGEAWLALGDMAELGQDAQSLHDEALRYALERGIRQCFALGEKSCRAVKLFGDAGYCFTTHADMADFIAPRLERHINLLVKGSRSAGMDKLVDRLVDYRESVNQSGGRHAV
jgi:UDP-N-acetylmuramoyl-tripeptide--D-alanyl-D-alanine ligase